MLQIHLFRVALGQLFVPCFARRGMARRVLLEVGLHCGCTLGTARLCGLRNQVLVLDLGGTCRRLVAFCKQLVRGGLRTNVVFCFGGLFLDLGRLRGCRRLEL